MIPILAETMRTAAALGYENVQAYLSSVRTSPVHPAGGLAAETARDAADADPVAGEEEAEESVCEEPPELHGNWVCEEERPETDRSEGYAQAPASPTPSPPAAPSLTLRPANSSVPLIQPGAAWSGPGYAIEGAPRRHPARGIFE